MSALAAVSDTCRPCARGQHEQCTLRDKCGCEDCNPPVAVWEDPPAAWSRQGYVIPDDLRAAMRANPGRWARIKDFPSNSSASTAAKKQRETNQGFEFLGRRVGKQGSALYGRYVGDTK